MPSLYDMITRHSIYLERVKNWFTKDFEKYLRKLEAELRAWIVAVDNGDSLGELTRKAYRRLLAQLETLQDTLYTTYGKSLLTKLRQFAEADFGLQRGLFSWGRRGMVASDLKASTMWAKVKAAVIPATTETPPDTLRKWITLAKDYVTQAVKKGYIDNSKFADVLKAIVGTVEAKLKDGALNKIRNSGSAILDTIVQHISNGNTGGIGGTIYEYYQWVSVIDSRTTPICTSRDHNVYPVGEGPLPPAHPRCRSRTVPCDADGSQADDRAFREWFRAQPDVFRQNVYAGNADDVDSYTDIRDNVPLSPNDLQTVLPFITAE